MSQPICGSRRQSASQGFSSTTRAGACLPTPYTRRGPAGEACAMFSSQHVRSSLLSMCSGLCTCTSARQSHHRPCHGSSSRCPLRPCHPRKCCAALAALGAASSSGRSSCSTSRPSGWSCRLPPARRGPPGGRPPHPCHRSQPHLVRQQVWGASAVAAAAAGGSEPQACKGEGGLMQAWREGRGRDVGGRGRAWCTCFLAGRQAARHDLVGCEIVSQTSRRGA